MSPSTPSLTDRQLIQRILAGHSGAFTLLIAQTEGLVAKIICNLIPSVEDQKDAVQETYMKVYDKLHTFAFGAKLSTWVGQIAYHTAITWLRKKKLAFPGTLEEEVIADPVMLPDARTIQKNVSELVTLQLTTLPSLYQLLLVLFHQQEQSYSEILLITGLPEGTVKSYLFRARKMLKDKILSACKKEELW